MANVTELAEADPVPKIADVISEHAGARLVYADPIVSEGVTVVPVARVRFGFGGGGGQSPRADDARRSVGGGGGGGVIAAPAGFLVLRGDEVSYLPIRDPARTAIALAAGALAISWALRALHRFMR
jgi:uncharacterized spore protein YtfJ